MIASKNEAMNTVFGWLLLFLVFKVDFLDHEIEVLIELLEFIFKGFILFSLFLDNFEPDMVHKSYISDILVWYRLMVF